MKQSELVAQIATDQEISISKARRILDKLGCIIVAELTAGGDVRLPQVGRLHTEQRAARRGRNPRTGEPLDIPARKVVTLSPTQALRNAVA